MAVLAVWTWNYLSFTHYVIVELPIEKGLTCQRNLHQHTIVQQRVNTAAAMGKTSQGCSAATQKTEYMCVNGSVHLYVLVWTCMCFSCRSIWCQMHSSITSYLLSYASTETTTTTHSCNGLQSTHRTLMHMHINLLSVSIDILLCVPHHRLFDQTHRWISWSRSAVCLLTAACCASALTRERAARSLCTSAAVSTSDRGPRIKLCCAVRGASLGDWEVRRLGLQLLVRLYP